ncbi:MAG: flippase-like domain-containing protein [Acidimicrobiales bacterium]|nr:flippase-like domain-containing protein [Acidimicrobiales bacterium]
MSDEPAARPDSSTGGGPPRRRRWIRVGQWVFVAALIAVLARLAVQNWGQLRDVELHWRPGWLVPAAIATAIASVVLPLAWRHLLIGYGVRLGRRAALRIWWVSQAARYFPTGLAAAASRVVLSAREGVPRSLAAASFALETALVVGWALLVFALASAALGPPWLRVLVLVAGVLGLAFLPWLLRLLGRLLPRFPSLAPGEVRTREVYEAAGLFGVNTLFRAARFVFLAAALVPVSWSDVPLLIGAAYAGVVAGMIGVTPAGLGVREGVITALLARTYPLGDAAAVAVALRAWDFAFEVLFLGLASLADRRRRRAPVAA